MLKDRPFVMALTTMVALANSFDVASAATTKKLTYDQAYQRCKAIMDKEGTPGTSTQSNVRYTRGAACMKKYGHKL
jgi:hypothetical protein